MAASNINIFEGLIEQYDIQDGGLLIWLTSWQVPAQPHQTVIGGSGLEGHKALIILLGLTATGPAFSHMRL
jgi:hypothetical protein